MAEIGATLRAARMGARIDVSEIEAKTKIRAKYLRALENEEWDLLPGPTFVRSFLRTYAQALGLDGKALVEEYRLYFERPSEAALEPIVSTPQRARGSIGVAGRSPGRPSLGYIAIVGVVVLVIVLLIVGLLSQGGGSPKTPSGTTAKRHVKHSGVSAGGAHAGKHRSQAIEKSDLASLKLEPTGEVYVCLIGDNESKRIPGLILKPGARAPIYHASRFLITLGNNEVNLIVNGTPHTVPASSKAIGYTITRSGLKPLAPGKLPTCK
jgi:cytoskeleton protein RodZ